MYSRNLYQFWGFLGVHLSLGNCLPENPTDDQVEAAIDAGTFANPSANVRPRFRYWIPDASVNISRVVQDIAGAAAAGAGGVEVLGYYLYGGNPGDFAPVDWSVYGWGTSAWKKLFESIIQAHYDNKLIMDFAMGPNQGQGVPANEGDDGLMWDLRPFTASVPLKGSFRGTIPGWGNGKLQAVITGTVTKAVNTSSSEPSLPNSPPSARLQKTLAADSLQDVTAQVSDTGKLSVNFSSDSDDSGLEHVIFAAYLVHSGARNQIQPTSLKGPQTKPQNFTENGSWTVDHFSSRGAKVMTDFWEKYLLVGGTKEALQQVGNYAWEDSIEMDANVYWTRDIPEIFQQRRGYSMNKWLPILFHQNALLEHSSTWFITDEVDAGNSHIADYRTTLTEQYSEYLDALRSWANSYLGIQFSAQVGYNMAVDMQSNIPHVNAPETECLAFDHSIDGYRQYSAPANMAGKRVISTECGANIAQSFQQPLPDLLWDFKRSIAGSVNNIIIHGFPYSGNYGNTTWPSFTTFTFAFSEMHGRHQPAWDFYSDSVGYMARVQYLFQSGVPRLDLAFYQKLTTYHNTPRNYQPGDLEAAGYSYGYLNPDNLDLPEAHVVNGILAPKRQAYKALIVRATDSMTVLGATKIAEIARAGLPVIFSGGVPSYLASYNASGAAYVNQTLSNIQGLKNVHQVPSDNIASAISSLGIDPLTKVKASATWYTYWRKNSATSEDYVFIYNDSPSGIQNGIKYSQGTVEFQSVGKPYIYDAWTGAQTPVANYTQTATTTTIFFRLAANQDVIVAFRKQEKPSRHAVSTPAHVIKVAEGPKGLEAHVVYTAGGSKGSILTSDGKHHNVRSISAQPFELNDWILTVEHWDPPASLEDIETVAVKHNTTHQLHSLTSWQNVDGLQHVSGRGYYTSNFTWPPPDASGAIISFGPIVHTIQVAVNGQTIPPLDTTAATADITKYLVKGTNQVDVVVATMLGNVLTPIWEQLRASGVPPMGLFGSPTKPSGNTDYGLLNPVVVTPYRIVKL